jgi:methyl-accepting chemotaxis protein
MTEMGNVLTARGDDPGAAAAPADPLALVGEAVEGRWENVPHDLAGPAGRIVARLRARWLAELDASVDLAMQTNEIAISAAQMLTATREVSAMAQDIAATGEELSASIGQIDGSVREATRLSDATTGAASGARRMADAASAAMTATAARVGSATDRIASFDGAAKGIGEIVGTIGLIARQTSLLAINASIEAARAGPAGRGFSIVAAEVKRLSEQTEQATRDIDLRIRALQSEVTAILAAMREGREAAEAGTAGVGTVREGVHAITGRIAALDERLREIAGTLAEQNAAAAQTANDVARIDAAGQRNLLAVERIGGAIDRAVTAIGKHLNESARTGLPEATLRIAKADHVVWKKRLVDGFEGRVTLRAAELASHRECRLGKWFYGPGSLPFRHLPAFRDLEVAHEAVHRSGIEAAKLMAAQDRDGAFDSIGRVEVASAEVLRQLDRMIAAV